MGHPKLGRPKLCVLENYGSKSLTPLGDRLTHARHRFGDQKNA